MMLLGRARVEGEALVKNADAHAVPSYGRITFALPPDG